MNNCQPKCIYFPDMSCSENEWIYDEQQYCKVRKDKKEFKCLYDGHAINWDIECPRDGGSYEGI